MDNNSIQRTKKKVKFTRFNSASMGLCFHLTQFINLVVVADLPFHHIHLNQSSKFQSKYRKGQP